MDRRIIIRVVWALASIAIVCAGGWIFWATVLLNGGDRLWYLTSPPTQEHLTRRLGGERVVEVLRRPDRVEAVLLDLPNDLIRQDPEPHEYQVTSDSQPVPTQVAQDIAEALTTPKLHRLIDPGTKSCVTRYGVRMRYYASEDYVDVYFCFTCMDLAVYLNDKPFGQMQFLFVCKRLLRDMQVIFPDKEEFVKLEKFCLRKSN